jgi:hypothetical protein
MTQHYGAGPQRRGVRPAHPARRPKKRALAWAGTVVGALIIAIVTAFGTGVGQHISSITIPHHRSAGLSVKIDAVSLERTALQAGTYMFPARLVLTAAQLQRLNVINPTQPQYDTWFRSRGGVDPDSSNLKVVVEGNGAHPVEITDIRAVKHCRRPLSGTLFFSPPAGNIDTIGIGFNLDSVTSIAENDDNGRLSGDFFASHTISLAPGEIQTLQITALTSRQYCQYKLELTVVDGDTTKTETIGNHGRPFQVTATVEKQNRADALTDPGSLSYYKVIYAGGLETSDGAFRRENPATYAP